MQTLSKSTLIILRVTFSWAKQIHKRIDLMRCDLLGQLSEIPGLDISNYDSKSLWTLLLCGSPLLKVIVNRIIMEATISFIEETKRFDWMRLPPYLVFVL